MKNASFQILRIGIAITFLWIGVLILKDPAGWGAYLQPWAANLLPFSLKTAMLGTALLDIIVGVLFLTDYLTWLAAALGSSHLIIVLATSGINAITVRDIGILVGAIALFVNSFPWIKLKRLK